MLYTRLIGLLQDLNKINRRVFNDSLISLKENQLDIHLNDSLYLMDVREVEKLLSSYPVVKKSSVKRECITIIFRE